MSFPPGTKMFQFPGFASVTYGFSDGYRAMRGGLPHSEISGSKPARGSPKLFAACHVLHRLLAPRHPPDALAFLDPPQRQPHLDAPPASAQRSRREKNAAIATMGDEATTYKSIPMLSRRTPQTEGKAGVRPCLPAPARATMHRRPKTGLDARERAVITTSRCERSSRRRTGGGSPRHPRLPGPPHEMGASGKRAGKGFPLAFGARTARPRAVPPHPKGPAERWWAWADLNGRPHAYQACALTS